MVNHSTYHRGQVVNYLRQLGVTDLESTDMFNFYLI
ncbi:DinB family protein [Haliscomenobacter sp.]